MIEIINTVMDFLSNNYQYIIGGIGLIALVGFGGYYFTKIPKEKRIALLKEWLRTAVQEADKALEGHAGQEKLKFVYDKAMDTFPWLEKIITFSEFCSYVDDALDWVQEHLQDKAE